MVAKACKWITDFRCYTMQVMKEDVKNKYIDIFNKTEFACLCDSNKAVIDWNDLIEQMSDETSEQV